MTQVLANPDRSLTLGPWRQDPGVSIGIAYRDSPLETAVPAAFEVEHSTHLWLGIVRMLDTLSRSWCAHG